VARIFLCHASEDKAHIREFYHRLAAIPGFEPWLDEEELLPGQLWEEEIPRALKASDFILIFFSRNSVAKRGYVQREMKLALDSLQEMPAGAIFTIPARLDECEIPEPFRRYHYANLFDPRGFDRLVRALHHGLLERGEQVPESLETPPAHPPPSIEEEDTEPAPLPTSHEAPDLSPSPESEPNRASEPPADQPRRDSSAARPDDTPAIIQPSLLPQTFTNTIGMKFVLIPAGTFTMGSPDSDTDAYSDEKPAHQVTISQPFYMGTCEVTQAQWKAIMGDNPSSFKGDDNRPVEEVSWEDAQQFIQKLNEREGVTRYRLPTEAEWEYAARAGTTTRYSFGNDVSLLATYGWYYDNSGVRFIFFGGSTKSVGQLRPNPWGLYDMHGNVREWVQDWYGPYSAAPVTDPSGPATGAHRVIRGGSWGVTARYARSAARGGSPPGLRRGHLGFRCLSSGGEPRKRSVRQAGGAWRRAESGAARSHATVGMPVAERCEQVPVLPPLNTPGD
jgi:formylglycine-generating enzyme required for sulfatase activity